jgi:enabled protein
LIKAVKYNQANQTFFQWRDGKQVYGLNFQNDEIANSFAQAFKVCVESLATKGLAPFTCHILVA